MLPIEFVFSLLLLFLGLLFGGVFGAATVVLAVERVGWVRLFVRPAEANWLDWIFLSFAAFFALLMLLGKTQARRRQINLNIDAIFLRIPRREEKERDALERKVRRNIARKQNGKAGHRGRKMPPKSTS